MRRYQCDIDGKNYYTGNNYEERGRLFLAVRGQVTRATETRVPVVLSHLGDTNVLAAATTDGWNAVHAIAGGNTLMHIVDGQLMSTVIGDDPSRAISGLIGVQVHVGGPMEVDKWDSDLLAFELVDLKNVGLDLELTGFTLDEIDELLHSVENGGLTDDDAVPEVPEAAVSQPGDVWLLGNHRLLCGDATYAGSHEQLMAGELTDIVFTDPPYTWTTVRRRRGKAANARSRTTISGWHLVTFFSKRARPAGGDKGCHLHLYVVFRDRHVEAVLHGSGRALRCKVHRTTGAVTGAKETCGS